MDSVPRCLLLDGATGTNLYLKGMPQGVCCEQWILDNPNALRELQADFITAGSDIIYAPTFGANRHKLSFFNLSDMVLEINKGLVALSKEVSKDRNVKVAGCISPTGLFVEPYGDITFDELVEIFKEQAAALNDAGVDLFVIETQLSVCEARAAILACRVFNKPIYVTVTITKKGRALSGATPLSALISLQGMGITAFGINCSEGLEIITSTINEIYSFSNIPLICKPNAGLPNLLIPTMYELSPTIMADMMETILDKGASVIGGCCGTTPEHIEKMRILVDNYKKPLPEKTPFTADIILSNEANTFSLSHDRLVLSPPLHCELDMSDVLMDIADDGVDVIRIFIATKDDALIFARNSNFAQLPVCFLSEDIDALERALYLYTGRAMIDSHSSIDNDQLHVLAKKYGAIVY